MSLAVGLCVCKHCQYFAGHIKKSFAGHLRAISGHSAGSFPRSRSRMVAQTTHHHPHKYIWLQVLAALLAQQLVAHLRNAAGRTERTGWTGLLLGDSHAAHLAKRQLKSCIRVAGAAGKYFNFPRRTKINMASKQTSGAINSGTTEISLQWEKKHWTYKVCLKTPFSQFLIFN